MSDQSTDVRETSTPSSLFGKKEMDYLQWIALSLQNPPMPVVIKKYLERAQAEGLDPQRIYEAAVKCRPDHWMKAPPYSEVAPTAEKLMQ